MTNHGNQHDIASTRHCLNTTWPQHDIASTRHCLNTTLPQHDMDSTRRRLSCAEVLVSGTDIVRRIDDMEVKVRSFRSRDKISREGHVNCHLHSAVYRDARFDYAVVHCSFCYVMLLLCFICLLVVVVLFVCFVVVVLCFVCVFLKTFFLCRWVVLLLLLFFGGLLCFFTSKEGSDTFILDMRQAVKDNLPPYSSPKYLKIAFLSFKKERPA